MCVLRHTGWLWSAWNTKRPSTKRKKTKKNKIENSPKHVFSTGADCQRNLVSAFFTFFHQVIPTRERATHENDGAHTYISIFVFGEKKETILLALHNSINNKKPIYLETLGLALFVRVVIEWVALLQPLAFISFSLEFVPFAFGWIRIDFLIMFKRYTSKSKRRRRRSGTAEATHAHTPLQALTVSSARDPNNIMADKVSFSFRIHFGWKSNLLALPVFPKFY